MSESELRENVKSRKCPQVFPAGWSFFCPGLGQLFQGRFRTFLGHFTLFAISAAVPLGMIVQHFRAAVPHRLLGNYEIPLILLLGIFPAFLVLFSVLDATHWSPEESVPGKSPLRPWIIAVVLLYLFSGVFLTVAPSLQEAARRIQCAGNVKIIGFAFHQYHDKYKSLPPAYTVGENGKPLHSWRVLLLPYLEEQGLYEKIRLDEPWDSEYNRQFHDVDLRAFQCPTGSKDRFLEKRFPNLDLRGDCFYSVILGEETPFPPGRTVNFGDMEDGTENTILVVERLLPVCWMDPNHEIPYETALQGINRNLYGIGSMHTGSVLVVSCDGVENSISESVDPEDLKAALTIRGGEKHVLFRR